MNTEFTTMDLASLILNEKNEKIKPENIRHNVQIFDIVGNYKGDTGASYSPKFLLFSGLGTNRHNASTMGHTMYEGTNLNIFDAEHIDTSNLNRLEYTFSYCDNLTTLEELQNWNTSNVKYMNSTFGTKWNLTSFHGLENWDTSNVVSITNFISYCHNVNTTEPLKNWDLSKVRTIYNMFYSINNNMDLCAFGNRDYVGVSIDSFISLSNSQTSLTNFTNCNFTNCNIQNFIISCSNLQNLSEISTWNITNCSIQRLTGYSQPRNFNPGYTMHGNNVKLWDLFGLQSYTNTSNLRSTGNYEITNCNAYEMFINQCNLSNVENIVMYDCNNSSQMFYYCNHITSISNMEMHFSATDGSTYQGCNLSMMFSSCSNLVDATSLDNWDYTDKVTTGSTRCVNVAQMFAYCNNLSNDSVYAITNFLYNTYNYISNGINLNNSNGFSAFAYTNINVQNILDSNRINELKSRGFRF